MRLLGLCKRAGQASTGVEAVRAMARVHRAKLVLVACDASQNAVKRVSDCCAFYGVAMIVTDLSMQRMGSALGAAPVAAVSVNDAGFAARMASLMRACAQE